MDDLSRSTRYTASMADKDLDTTLPVATLEGHPNASREQPTLHLGERVGGSYVVERFIAGGGMGQVYLARDERLDRPVAIKLLHGHIAAAKLGDVRFQREARALSRVVHPNVVATYAFGRHGEGQYLVMEYVDGPTLGEVINRRGAIPLEETLNLVRQIGSGLSEAHALGIVHRDVKPGNILIRRLRSGGMMAKVVDFGLAYGFEDEEIGKVTGRAELVGSPTYMSPEQIQGKDLDGRSDLYSLAVVIYQMLAGCLPFQADSLQSILLAHLTEEPIPLIEHFSHERAEAIGSVLSQALSKKSEERPGTIEIFIAELNQAAGHAIDLELEAVRCGVCRQMVSPDGGFCKHCAAAVPLRACNACGTLRQGERYHCIACGASLISHARMGAVRLSGGEDGKEQGGELTPATAVAVVVRLEGDDLPPAAASEFYEIFGTHVERERGRMLAVLGLEGVAMFGLGGMREREVQQAVDAALSLQQAFSLAWEESEISVRIGVEVGRVMTRGAGSAWGTSLATGAAVETARQAASEAPGIGVFICEDAYREVRGIYETEQAGSLHRVLSHRSVSLEQARFTMAGRAVPLLGREFELNMLQRSFEQASKGQQISVVPIIGAAGVGKTRLLADFLKNLKESDVPHTVDIGACMPSDTAPPFASFRAMFRARHLFGENANEESLDDKLRGLPGISNLPAETAHERVKHLARLLGLSLEDVEERPVFLERKANPVIGSSDGDQELAFEAYTQYIRGLTEEAPLVLVFDDLQWARPTTLRLLSYLAHGCVDVPLLVLLAMRTVGAERTMDTSLRLPAMNVSALQLSEFSAQESTALMAAILGKGVVPEKLGQTIHEVSNGVPQEIGGHLEALIADGVFVKKGKGWKLDKAALGEAELPGSISGVVVQRLGRLAPAERELLSAASVAGQSFSDQQIANMMGRDVTADEIDVLVAEGWLTETRSGAFPDSRELCLRQTQVREILLEILAPRRAKSLHRRAAEWLVSQVGIEIPGRVARLAGHYREAGDKEQGARFTIAQAREAQHAYANQEAYDSYGKALGMARTLSGDSEVGETRNLLLEAALGRAQLGFLLGEYDQAIQALKLVEELGQEAEYAPLTARALVINGDILLARGVYQDAEPFFERARDVALETGNDGLAVYAQGRQAMGFLCQQRLEDARKLAQDVQKIWARKKPEDVDLLRGLGSATGVLGQVSIIDRDFKQAMIHYKASRDYRAQAGDGVGTAMAQVGMGNTAFWAEDLETAQELYETAVKECERIGYRRGAAIALSNSSEVCLEQKEPEGALQRLSTAEAIMRSLGIRDLLSDTLRIKGQALEMMDDHAGARAAAEEAIELAREFEQEGVEKEALALLGRL
jgi:tetratricopeptide (TPR) repeat protein/class 3 adenylate cyclase